MKRYAIILVFISVLVWRVITGQSERIVEGTRVRLLIPTIDYPEHTDSQTIVRRGEWEARIKGYTDFIPGEVVEIEGVVDERGRILSDTVSQCHEGCGKQLVGIDYLLVQIAHFRHWAVGRLQSVLPEPHASLAIGILLGVKRGMPREFYEQLVNTGTLHIVAASGYNVAVVGGVVGAIFSKWVTRSLVSLGSIIAIAGYVLLAGASPSIVRAGIMGSLSLIGLCLGRVREARRLLLVSCYIMLMFVPSLITNIGFQLSVAATGGLLWLNPLLEKIWKNEWLQQYLYPTLAASLATAPIIWFHFGRVSLLGIVANMLVLPVTPLVMLLSAMTVVYTPFGYLLYVPLMWMVLVIRGVGI